MKTISLRMLPLATRALATRALGATACCRTDAPGPSPAASHEYAVEYRISSPSSPADYVSHRNETEAMTALPATYSFKRTLKTGARSAPSPTCPAA